MADQTPHDGAGAGRPEGGASAAEEAARAQVAEERLAEILLAYRRLKSEHDGYRDRLTRNLERRFEQRRDRMLLRFIEILDNLDRALEAAERVYVGNPLIEGLILVRTQVLQTLKDEGLEWIPVAGLPYDPVVSEAVETQPVDDAEQHHVVLRDLQRGYRLHGRVARPSKVRVGIHERGVPAAESPPASPAAQAAATGPAEGKREDSGRYEEITLSGLSGLVVPDPQAAAVHETAAEATELEDDKSLDEIVARAEAQRALFPSVFAPETDAEDSADDE